MWSFFLLINELILLYLILNVTRFDIISPGVVTLFMFTASTVCMILNTNYWHVDFSIETALIVLLGLFAIVLDEMVVCSCEYRKNCWQDVEIFKNEQQIIVSNPVYVLFLVFGIMAMLWYLYSIIKLAGINGLAAISIVKYDTELNLNNIAKACYRIMRQVPFPFLFIFMHNIVLCKGTLLKNLKYLIPVGCSIMMIFFSGSRAPCLTILLAGFIYYIFFLRMAHGWKKRDVNKVFRKMSPYIAILLIFFVSTSSIVKNKESAINSPIKYFEYYLGSGLHLFDKIVQDKELAYPDEYNLFGAHTFAAFWQDMNEKGIVSEYVQSEDGRFVRMGGDIDAAGNVYTIFSAPFNDFGIVGMLIFIIILYTIYNHVYYKRIKYAKYIRCNYGHVLVWGYLYNYIFMAFFKTTTTTIKIQTIFEGIVMYIIYLMLTKVKIKPIYYEGKKN